VSLATEWIKAMAFHLKGQKTPKQLLADAEDRIDELLSIINQQKREIERLKLTRSAAAKVKSNLDYLDEYPIKGLWPRGVSGGSAGTI
jgi:hypothetical protein